MFQQNMSSEPRPHRDKKRAIERRDIPDMPRSYNPQYTFDLNDLKKRILSNAHVYYAHRFPEAQRYDFITSSIPPTDRRDRMEYRGALIVYPDPKSNTWAMLYKSHSWIAVEDTTFGIKSWFEEKMSAVFDKMDDGEKWAASKKNFQNGVSDNERKSTVDEDKMADVQNTKGSPRSQDTAADHVGNGTDIGDKDIDKEIPKQPEDSTSSDQVEATSNTAMPFRKRKSAVKEDEGRKKSRKNDEKERVFVGKKDDPPTRDEKKAAAEPVVIPSQSKLLPTTKR